MVPTTCNSIRMTDSSFCGVLSDTYRRNEMDTHVEHPSGHQSDALLAYLHQARYHLPIIMAHIQ